MRKPVIHDFRGPNRWGCALHADTFGEAPPRIITTGRLWRKKRREIPRAQVMVHMSPSPQAGDTLLYTGHDELPRRMTIVEVRPCYDPHDMFTLILERPEKPT